MQEKVLLLIKPGLSKSEGARQADGRGRSEARLVNPTNRDGTRGRWMEENQDGKAGR